MTISLQLRSPLPLSSSSSSSSCSISGGSCSAFFLRGVPGFCFLVERAELSSFSSHVVHIACTCSLIFANGFTCSVSACICSFVLAATSSLVMLSCEIAQKKVPDFHLRVSRSMGPLYYYCTTRMVSARQPPQLWCISFEQRSRNASVEGDNSLITVSRDRGAAALRLPLFGRSPWFVRRKFVGFGFLGWWGLAVFII